ncbi:hypothetical protein CEE45_10690 [Candidatus Heimdallarchaeota archaeon B3_Heim]|nr:MAG: hypothetical protein CEE45_10690 [Candidatus Heimdallarchaeota archaeon B3_Heim]
MNPSNQSFSDRIKASVSRIVNSEVNHFQAYEKEYKISSHPIKRTFATISRLSKLHDGRIAIAEVAKETKLSENDIVFIIQEFTAQRLIDGIIEKDPVTSEQILVLREDTYHCQIDQTEHSVFDLHFQCETCLRFICSSCYQSVQTDTCPYCKGDLIPVPRIFKKEDVKSFVNRKSAVSSLGDYYQAQKTNLSSKGVKTVSSTIINDIKAFNKRRWSFSDIKNNTRTFLDFRKQEKEINKHKKAVLDTIAMIHDIEGKKQIPLTRIARVNKLEIPLVNMILRNLVEQQLIQGFLDTSGTYDTASDDYLILGSDKIRCYLHEGEISISAPHYQCLTCFRSVCPECYSTMKETNMSNCMFCGGEMQPH